MQIIYLVPVVYVHDKWILFNYLRHILIDSIFAEYC